ncbi:hypothetical protein CcaverHIS002_0205150 [Cutaneotrichosporon cavernicola]|uniref:L domain-like protein n=1 Tax=Cutaneotrichosporon cavernicola TaxID=279322 RepID=A0AA48L169_9TREE|nr:uncharacterized protein CcaverHIS019_0205120 [Cutaneotrichosporon cavernicola]BEI81355.1 hypothetical protein CcaverHIS002_0205150 [Cutaneotrichosporon cavernicola]BEI89150.1 hypothetical protein CcaverHIS019_0205120 [Cutaneotrichosporon cavernicola]BEI96927.1 hypothetical protein CcaverHIS631_0205160 [Cutaneotrichosporon cavernicola]BEJ04699.1 hypothetical protein CcaverHIS641_0205160 [Cutaneotrichosporon cavernicola]
MDRGAARSRKRTQKAEYKAKTTSVEDNAKLAKLLDKDKPNGKGKRERPPRKQKEPAGPDQYKAKAIRTARALVYAQEAFEIPPPPERLAGVTRVDLDGAECTDISWLPASVTWLSVKACPVTEGWDVVGALEGLTVLNISNCQLSALPPLAGLKGLKALVATGNEWTSLDDTVVSGWKELNSLIISHSPNLTSLPSSLSSLPHLSKLAFSHCPNLEAAGLPDLSPLPLLRDVKANNLARLSTLPSHLPKWGTGDLDAVGKSGVGDGLEVLDLGNCSLPYSAVAGVFGLSAAAHAAKKEPRWAHLRSLTLRANPLTVEVPAYADQLQASPDLPKLQIIDARRVKERARAGEVQESRRDRKAREAREKKARPTGANEHSGGKEMRKWGADVKEAGEEKEKEKEQTRSDAADEPERKKRKRDEKPQDEKRKRDEAPADESSKKKRKRKHGKGEDKEEVLAVATPAKPVVVVKPAKQERAPVVAAVATHVAVADPAAQRAKKPGRSETAVVGVVDVAPARRGLDLKAALKEESGSGLGLGGW